MVAVHYVTCRQYHNWQVSIMSDSEMSDISEVDLDDFDETPKKVNIRSDLACRIFKYFFVCIYANSEYYNYRKHLPRLLPKNLRRKKHLTKNPPKRKQLLKRRKEATMRWTWMTTTTCQCPLMMRTIHP